MQIIVVGCGKVGSTLAAALIAQNHDVVIIDQDEQLLAAAADLDCIKISGVPIDRDILRQAGIETADFLCAVTQNDNINIMVSQIADLIFKVPHIIARIYNPASRSVFEAFGLNTVCSTELTVQELLLRIEGRTKSARQTVFGRQVIYSTEPVDAELAGEKLSNLATNDGKLLFGLLRQDKLLLARPDMTIQAGDELVLADLR
ncbi:MAG: TrkA family potassium uptake protein [Ruminococcaceae bacterium]|nr:TrkA family potassium uptake protein [Oscillospiraceae bacterium]